MKAELLYPKIKSHQFLKLIFSALLISSIYCQTDTFQAITLSTSSNTVNAQSTLTVSATLTSRQFTDGDTLTITLPNSDVAFNDPSGMGTSICTSLTAGILFSSCTPTSNDVMMTLSVASGASTLQFTISNFKNPYSTTPVTGFDFTLTDLSSTLIATDSTLAKIEGLDPDGLLGAVYTPQSDLIADSGTMIQISFTLKNPLRPLGTLIFYFPLWNPDDGPSAKHQILLATPYCKPIANLNPLMSCAYKQSTQSITITTPVAAETPGGTTLTFVVDNFLNPYNGKPKSGYTVVTTDQLGGFVDSSVIAGITISIQVSTWNTFGQARASREDIITTIREASVAKISIAMDIPIDPYCRIEIVFPADMPLTVDLTQVSSMGVIATMAPKAPDFINVAQSRFYLDGCTAYNSRISTAVSMFKVRNKDCVKQTESFKVYLWALSDAAGTQAFPIAKQEDFIFLYETDFSIGSVVSLFVTAVDTYTIQKHTRYAVSFKTIDPIPNNSKIKVRFPTTITLVSGVCNLQSASTPLSLAADCQVVANTVVLTFPFQDGLSYDPLTTGSLSFVFDTGGMNPQVACDAGSFHVSTFAIFFGNDYAIDYYMFNSQDDHLPRFSAYIPIAATLSSRMLPPSSYVTYNAPTTYTLEVTPQLVLPRNSLLSLVFPPTVQLMTGLTQISCTAHLPSGENIATLTTPTSLTPITFTLTTVFRYASYTQTGQSFTLVCEGLQNPKTLEPTSSFSVAIFDQYGCGLERISSGIILQMFGLPSFQSVIVLSSVPYNGQPTVMTIQVIPTIIFASGFSFYITFPPEITLPADPNCLADDKLSLVVCTGLPENRLRVDLTFTISPHPAANMFAFKVLDLYNPISTTPTTPFSLITAFNTLGDQVASLAATGPILINTEPAIAMGILEQSNTEVGTPAIYTFTYTTVNPMRKGIGFAIEYPASVIPNATLTTCLVIFRTVTYPMGHLIDTVNRKIYITRGLPVVVPKGSKVKIQIGWLTNPESQLQTGISFILTSFTDTTWAYSIDKVATGLVPIFKCQYPCKTCPSKQQAAVCLSCFQAIPIIPEIYLNGTKCLVACPVGTQANSNKVCLAIHTKYIEMTSYVASHQPTYYSFVITPTGDIPTDSTIKITLPSEVSLMTGEITTTCETTAYISPWKKYQNHGVTTLIQASPNLILLVDKVFQVQVTFGKGSIITLRCGKFKNPRSLAVTVTNTLVELFPPGSASHIASWSFPLQMKQLPSFRDFTVTPSSLITGTNCVYTFTMITGQEMKSGMTIQIDLPLNLTLAGATLVCSPISAFLASITCTQIMECLGLTGSVQVPTGKVKAKVMFSTDPLTEGSTISFSLSNVGNLPSTQPQQILSISFFDTDGTTHIEQYSRPYPFITMATGAEIATKSISLDTQTIGTKTGLTITYTTINRMPVTSVLVIGYPTTAQFTQNEAVGTGIFVGAQWRGSVASVDPIKKEVIIELYGPQDSTITLIPAGSVITINVKAFTNAALSTSTESFTVKSFTDTTRRYLVDQITSGLTLFSCLSGQYLNAGVCTACPLPCKTCLSATVCLSCYDTSSQPVYYQGNCFSLVTCPAV